MLPIFVQITENDKRLILAFLLVLILLFVLIGYIGMLIVRIMRWQGKKLDNMVADVLTTRVITNKKHFTRYARKKNWRYFFKQSWIPLLILLGSVGTLVVRGIIQHDFWSYNPFNNVDGFSSLLFLWDFGNKDYYTTVFNITLLSSWPAVINSPHFVVDAIPSYIFTIGLTIGGLWYLWTLQTVIARTIRMFQLGRSVFDKNLDKFNTNDAIVNGLNNNVNPAGNASENQENNQQ